MNSNTILPKSQREWLLIIGLALLCALIIVRQVPRPTYTDSYYHFNAAARLASGQGLTDAVIWTYVGQPPSSADTPTLVTPSHLYWMPFTSMLAGLSMAIFNAPGVYAVSQLPSIGLYAGTIVIAYALGWQFGGTRRHALVAALLTIFSGFFAKFWGETDTFAPYAFTGSLCLFALASAMTTAASRRRLAWGALAGVMAGLGHLTRSDGMLLVIVGVICLVIDRRVTYQMEGEKAAPLTEAVGTRAAAPLRGGVGSAALIVFIFAYLVVMLPWFLRMRAITGSPLPVGGLQGAWFTEYNDLFRYPPDASASEFFANGVDLFVQTRWLAFVQNLQTFIAVEGYIVLMPLMLVGWFTVWRTQRAWALPFAVFALGLHAAMTLVFPYPGWRGGLLHGAAALIPFWAAFATVGLDSVVLWIAGRRRRWQPRVAVRVFSVGMVLLACVLTFHNLSRVLRSAEPPRLYTVLQTVLPSDARILINDPAALYYFTGLGGAVLPNESADVIPLIARRYGITHVLIEAVRSERGHEFSGAAPSPLQDVFNAAFLREIDLGDPLFRDSTRLYAIDPLVLGDASQ